MNPHPQYGKCIVDASFPESADTIAKFEDFLSHFLSSESISEKSRFLLLSKKSVFSAVAIMQCIHHKTPYIPVDTDNPDSRKQTMIDSIQPHFIFTDDDWAEKNIKQSFSLVWQHDKLKILRIDNADFKAHPKELSHVLFTSGSTGLPKGVMTSVNNNAVFCEWILNEFKVNEASRILSVAPFHFDLSVFDLGAVRLKNSALFLPPQSDMVNPMALAQFIVEQKIDTFYATPTWITLLTRYGKLNKYDFGGVKLILVAGEAFTVQLANGIHKHFYNAQVANLYGPTETNVCTFYKIDYTKTIDALSDCVSIGKACPYAQLHINDEDILDVSGESVMLGYWPETISAKQYSTGDVVKMENNLLFYQGRRDNMIKRNGFRIETAEVQAALMRMTGIESAVVLPVTENDKTLLVAHLLSAPVNSNVLLEFCSKNLPSYMIPDRFVFHQEFPLNSSGKIDYIRLKNLS